MSQDKRDEWELPRLYSTFSFQNDFQLRPPEFKDTDSEFMDVQFYPYLSPTEQPIFAACSPKHVLICRLSPKTRPSNSHPVQVIQVVRDEDEKSDNWTLTWAMAEDATPLLCISGADAKIKVYDVVRRTCYDTLVGHGDHINDLKTSPSDPLIIASASKDTTVRVWSLKSQHKAQPCMYILGGDAHRYDLLTVAFHENGRYILSSGHDQIINLWTLSGELPEKSKPATQPIQIFYPHFFTNEVHSSLIDCVSFFGDLILSRACYEHKIVVWSINGFDSKDPLPPRETAPSSYDPNIPTRSAFESGSAHFTRLLELQTRGLGGTDGNMFYMRFGMYTSPDRHPILAFGNATSKIFFWDFARIQAFHDYTREVCRGNMPRAPKWLPNIKSSKGKNPRSLGSREPAAAVSGSGDGQRSNADDGVESGMPKYGTTDPTKPLVPHHTVILPAMTVEFVARNATWSPNGEWCVVCGSGNRCAIMRRWF